MCSHLGIALRNMYLECTTAFLESVKWICKHKIHEKYGDRLSRNLLRTVTWLTRRGGEVNRGMQIRRSVMIY